jgi:ABC-type spermidine/putrescine transport system permease subunit I
LLEAAYDAGAGRWRILTEIVLPLSKTGIALVRSSSSRW